MILKPNIRTRFAPSPTGYLHLGSARTALFNHLFTQHYNGKMIVRFEDTDQKRSLKDVIIQQLDNLRWLGIHIDETINVSSAQYGPYLQSERLDLYHKYADLLWQNQQVYYCFCTPEQLAVQRKIQQQQSGKAFLYDRRCYHLTADQVQNFLSTNRSYCLRFLTPALTKISFRDLTFGKITFQSEAVEDFVIIKNDGFPTYNFAAVVDDYLMKITHIMRGVDHLTNTAKQWLLYQAFKWEIPTFAHFTLLQIDQKNKISKRRFQKEHYLEHYRQIGVLPIAMRNFLVLLGWSPPGKKEIFTDRELISYFDGKGFNRSPSIIDLHKLYWLNHKHIQNLSQTEFWRRCQPYLTSYLTRSLYDFATWEKIVALFQKEVQVLAEIKPLVKLFVVNKFTYSPAQHLILKNNHLLLKAFYQELLVTAKQVWNAANLKVICKQVQTRLNLFGKLFYHPLRIAITGQDYGPPFHTLLALLGAKKTLLRLHNLVHHDK